MTQSFSPIPDGFSMDQLKDMMSEAIPEDVAHECELCGDSNCDEDHGPHGSANLTDDQVIDIADKALTQATDACDDPIVHKVMLHMIVGNMYSWHQKVGEDSDQHAWSRDAGKFQAIMNILDTISVGPDDFTCDFE